MAADKPRRSLLRSAGVVGAMTLLSRITGLLQSRMLAHYLGVGFESDAFNVAYRLPNLLRRFTAEGTMTAAFLPTVSETEAAQGEGAAQDLVARFLGTLGILLALLCTLCILGMVFLTGLQMLGHVAPGAPVPAQFQALWDILMARRAAPPDLLLTTALARIMFPYLLLVSLTAGLSAVLNLKGRFGLPAAVNLFWNLAFMGFALLCFTLGPRAWRDPVRATFFFAMAVLVGGFAQLFVLWPSFRKLGYGLRWGLFLGHAGVKKALARMAPGLIGTGIHPINVFISTILASQLARGAQTVLANSNMMGEAVLGIFATSVATVSLPAMTRLADAGDDEGLRSSLASALRGTALLALPSAMGMAVLARPIIALIFRTGRFDAHAVEWTATTLAFQSVGLLFIATNRITAQALYALKDYRSPAFAALLGMVANVILSILLMKPLDTGGIALANGLSSLVGLGYLTWNLQRRLPRLPYARVLRGWALMGAASGCMGLLAWKAGHWMGTDAFRGLGDACLRLFPLIALCGLFYFALLLLLRNAEARSLLGILKRKLGRG